MSKITIIEVPHDEMTGKKIEIDLRLTCVTDPEKGLVCRIEPITPALSEEKIEEHFIVEPEGEHGKVT
jgi:hypothetical protein